MWCAVVVGDQVSAVDAGWPSVDCLEGTNPFLQGCLVRHVVSDSLNDHAEIVGVGADHAARFALQVATLASPILTGDKERCARPGGELDIHMRRAVRTYGCQPEPAVLSCADGFSEIEHMVGTFFAEVGDDMVERLMHDASAPA